MLFLSQPTPHYSTLSLTVTLGLTTHTHLLRRAWEWLLHISFYSHLQAGQLFLLTFLRVFCVWCVSRYPRLYLVQFTRDTTSPQQILLNSSRPCSASRRSARQYCVVVLFLLWRLERLIWLAEVNVSGLTDWLTAVYSAVLQLWRSLPSYLLYCWTMLS